MSPYIASGYSIALVTLAGYALSLVARERRARRRLGLSAPGRGRRHGVAPELPLPPSETR